LLPSASFGFSAEAKTGTMLRLANSLYHVILSVAKNLVPRASSCPENPTINIYARNEILRYTQWYIWQVSV
jgi:hypothetical protein